MPKQLGARRCCRSCWYSVNNKTLQAVLTQIRQLTGNEAALPNEETDWSLFGLKIWAKHVYQLLLTTLGKEILRNFLPSWSPDSSAIRGRNCNAGLSGMAQQGTHDRSMPAGDQPPPELMLLELARKQFGTLSRAEEELFRAAEEGRRAFALAGDGWDNNPANVANWNADRVARGQCITWLCTDPRESALVTHHGLDLYGVQIDAELRTLSLTNCYIKRGVEGVLGENWGSFLLRDRFKAEGEVRLLWPTTAGSSFGKQVRA